MNFYGLWYRSSDFGIDEGVVALCPGARLEAYDPFESFRRTARLTHCIIQPYHAFMNLALSPLQDARILRFCCSYGLLSVHLPEDAREPGTAQFTAHYRESVDSIRDAARRFAEAARGLADKANHRTVQESAQWLEAEAAETVRTVLSAGLMAATIPTPLRSAFALMYSLDDKAGRLLKRCSLCSRCFASMHPEQTFCSSRCRHAYKLRRRIAPLVPVVPLGKRGADSFEDPPYF